MKHAPELPRCPANEAILATLTPLDPERRVDPYWLAGSHPDVVERVWDELGLALSRPCAFVSGGHALLAHPSTYSVFALPYGTAYVLWLPPSAAEAARGRSTVRHWSDGRTTDLATALDEGWVFGDWGDREVEGCEAALRWWDDHPPA